MLSELGKRAQKAIRKKGTQPGVSFYGQAYMNTLIKKYGRVVAGTSTMKPENIPKLYRDVVNATLKHAQGKAYSVLNQELRNVYKLNQSRVFEKKAGKTRIKNVALPETVLSRLASIATTDPNIYIQNMVSEKQGFENRLREEYGIDIHLTDAEYNILSEEADRRKDEHGEYSGWYSVFNEFSETLDYSWDISSLVKRAQEGDVLSLMILQKGWDAGRQKAKKSYEDIQVAEKAYLENPTAEGMQSAKDAYEAFLKDIYSQPGETITIEELVERIIGNNLK